MSANSAYGVYFTYFTPHGMHSVTNHLNSSDQRTYDGVQRLAAVNHFFNPPGYTAVWSYGYNPASQLASIARSNDIYAWNGHYAVNRAYAADGLNRYTAAGNASFGYDANGNLTSDGSRTYTYDIENRLVGASGGLVLAYDPLGRLHRTSGGPSGTTTYLYDGDALVAEYDGSGAMSRRHAHRPGVDAPMQTYTGAGFAQYFQLHADHQGSIFAVVDAGGTPAINRYDEYGIPAATNTGRFQYTGQIWLPDLGMYHYKARVYSPTLGRFMQVDPIGYDDQFNLYAYVGNDPVNHTDPSGQQAAAALASPWLAAGSSWAALGALLGPAAPAVGVAVLHGLVANAFHTRGEQTLAGDTVSAARRRTPVPGTGRRAGRPQHGAVRPGQSGPARVVRPTHPVKKSDGRQVAGRGGRHGGVIGSRGDRERMGGRQDDPGHQGGTPHGHPPGGRGRGHFWDKPRQ